MTLARNLRRKAVAVAATPVLLFHFDGSNGSTTFTDSSPSGHVPTTGGSPVISTAQSKFGGSSLSLNGSSHLLLDGSSDFAFGTGDFTVDFWLRMNALPASYAHFFDCRTAGGDTAWRIEINSSGQLQPTGLNASINLSINTWYHVAVVRYSGTCTLYIDGVSRASAANSSNYINQASRPSIGTQGDGVGSGRPNCYIDEMRVLKGTAAWTAGFTPPSAAY